MSENYNADDSAELTADWLRAVGGKQEEHPQKILFERADAMPIGLWNVADGWKAMLVHSPSSASCMVRGLTTRSQFRRLAEALGIELQETSQ